MTERDRALTALLYRLKEVGYQFTVVTPATHARIVGRAEPGEVTLRDVFGWSRHFTEQDVPQDILELMREADAIEHEAGRLKSKVRVASLGQDLFLHSAYPTIDRDAVFFGPDTYRFASF